MRTTTASFSNPTAKRVATKKSGNFFYITGKGGGIVLASTTVVTNNNNNATGNEKGLVVASSCRLSSSSNCAAESSLTGKRMVVIASSSSTTLRRWQTEVITTTQHNAVTHTTRSLSGGGGAAGVDPDEFYEDEDAYGDFDASPPSSSRAGGGGATSSTITTTSRSLTDSLIEEDITLSEEVANEEKGGGEGNNEGDGGGGGFRAKNGGNNRSEQQPSRHYAKGFKQGRREFDPEQITSTITAERHSALNDMMSSSSGGGDFEEIATAGGLEGGGDSGDKSMEKQLVEDAMLLSFVGIQSVGDKALSQLQNAEKGTPAFAALQTLKRHRAAQTEGTPLLTVSEILGLLDSAKGPTDVRNVFEKHILTNPLFNDVFNGHGTRVAVMGHMTAIVAKTFSSDVFLEIASLAISNGFNLTRLHINELLTAIRVDLTAMFQQYGRDPKIVMTTLRRLQICMALSKQDGVVFEGVFLSRLLLMCTIMVTYFDRQNYYRNSFPADFMRREGLVSDWVISHVRASDYDECIRVLSKFVKETILDDHHLHNMCIRPGFTTLYRLLDFFFATDNLTQMIATMEEAQEHLDMNLAEATIAKMMQMACSFNYPLALELFRKYRLLNKESVIAAPDMSRLMSFFGRSGGGIQCPHCKEPFNHRNVQLEVWESTPVQQRACPLLRMQREQRGELEELSAMQPDTSALDAFRDAQKQVFKIVQARIAAEQEVKKKSDETLFLSTGKHQQRGGSSPSKTGGNSANHPPSKESGEGESPEKTLENAEAETKATAAATARVDADLVSSFPAQVSFPPAKVVLASPEIDSPQCRDWSGFAISLFEYSQTMGLEWGMAEWRGFLQCCTFLREPEDIMSILKKDLTTSEKLRREHADRTLGHTDLNPSQAWRLLSEDVPLVPTDLLRGSAATESGETATAQQQRTVDEENRAISSLMGSSYSLSINNVTALLRDPDLTDLQRRDAFFLIPNNNTGMEEEEDSGTDALRAAAEFQAGGNHLHNILRLYRLESAKDVVCLKFNMIRKPRDDGSAAFDCPRMRRGVNIDGTEGDGGGRTSAGSAGSDNIYDVLDDGHGGGGRNSQRGVGTSIVPTVKPPTEQFNRRPHEGNNNGGGRGGRYNKPKSPFEEEANEAAKTLSIHDQYELYKPLLLPPSGTPTPGMPRNWISLSRREKFEHILYNILQPNINRQKHFEDIIARLYLRFLRINDPALVYPTIQDWFANGVGLGRTRRGGEISPVISEEIVLAAFSVPNEQAKLRADFAQFSAARVRDQDLFLMAMAKRRARFALWANGLLVKLPKKHPRVVKAMSANAFNIPDPHERRIRRSEERRYNANADEDLIDVVFPAIEQSRFADSETAAEVGFVYMVNPCAIGEHLPTNNKNVADVSSSCAVANEEDAKHNRRTLKEFVYLARKMPRNVHARVEFKDSGSDIVPNSGKKNWYTRSVE